LHFLLLAELTHFFFLLLSAIGPRFGAATRAGKEFASQAILSEKELYDEPEA
jgi:hypothetical protein